MNNQKMGYFQKGELGLEPHEGGVSGGAERTIEVSGPSGFIAFANIVKDDSSLNRQLIESLYQPKTDRVVSPSNPLYTTIRNQLMGTPETGPVVPLAQQKEVEERKPRPSVSAEEQLAYLRSLSGEVKLRQEVPIDQSKKVILTQDTVRMNIGEMKELAVKRGLVSKVLGISDVVYESLKVIFEKVNAETGHDLVNGRKSKIANMFEAVITQDNMQGERGVTGQGTRHNG